MKSTNNTIKAAALVVLTAFSCWLLFRSTRRDGNTRMQFINTKKPEAMTHVNFTTSGVALTDPK